MIVSKLTSKAQTTIPQPIRAALGLQPGDELLYEIILSLALARTIFLTLPNPNLEERG